MLPKTLQSSVCPAKSLTRQHSEFVRCLSPTDRALFVTYLVSKLPNAQCQILILRKRIRIEPTAFFNQLATPCSDGARDDSNAIQARKRASIHVLRSDVFERLPPRDNVDTVANLCISCDGTDRRVDKSPRQGPNRLRGKLCIGIERHDDIALCMAESKIKRDGLTGVL